MKNHQSSSLKYLTKNFLGPKRFTIQLYYKLLSRVLPQSKFLPVYANYPIITITNNYTDSYLNRK